MSDIQSDSETPENSQEKPEKQAVVLLARDNFERLELVAPPPMFDDGSVGIYRNTDPNRKPLIQATNDWEAVQSFLRDKAKTGSAHTVRAYEKECLRLFLWCRFVALKPFSSLDRDDTFAYESFLRRPPKEFVLHTNKDGGYRPTPMLLENGQGNPAWRPFRKAELSDGSVRTAMAALKSLSKYLVNVDYLRASPFTLGGLAKRNVNQKHEIRKKVIRERARQAVDAVIANMPDKTPAQRKRALRRRYIFDLFYYLGIRMDEALNANMGAFEIKKDKCWFEAFGKGQKKRTVPVPEELIRSLKDYRMAFDMTPDFPLPNEKSYLISNVRGDRAIKDTQLRRMLIELFRKAAVKLDELSDGDTDIESMQAIDVLEKATPHWLRHTYATDLFDAGVDPRHIQENMGHSSMDTTLIYNENEDKARHEDTDQRTKTTRQEAHVSQ